MNFRALVSSAQTTNLFVCTFAQSVGFIVAIVTIVVLVTDCVPWNALVFGIVTVEFIAIATGKFEIIGCKLGWQAWTFCVSMGGDSTGSSKSVWMGPYVDTEAVGRRMDWVFVGFADFSRKRKDWWGKSSKNRVLGKVPEKSLRGQF